MKKKEVQRFANERLLPYMKGFRADGNLLYKIPVGNILRAFLFDSSGFSAESFYPQVFVQPLYVPVDYLTMTVGLRFRGVWHFESGNEQQLAQRLLNEMQGTGFPFLRRHSSPEDIVHGVKENPALEVNTHLRQVLAYSLLILGRNDEGLDELDKLLALLVRISDKQPWARTIHAEVGTLRQSLMKSPLETMAILQSWAEQTRQSLNLPE